MSRYTFFDPGEHEELARAIVARADSKGLLVETVPTSGPPALWIHHKGHIFEYIGVSEIRRAIKL